PYTTLFRSPLRLSIGIAGLAHQFSDAHCMAPLLLVAPAMIAGAVHRKVGARQLEPLEMLSAHRDLHQLAGFRRKAVEPGRHALAVKLLCRPLFSVDLDKCRIGRIGGVDRRENPVQPVTHPLSSASWNRSQVADLSAGSSV